MFTKSFTNELIPASWERAGSGSEPSRNTPPSGWSLAASASCYPSQSQLLEGTLCFAPGTFFHPQYVDLYSSPSCNDLHSAVYPLGGLPVTEKIGNWMPILQRQQENNCPPWGPSNACLATWGEAWNSTIHHSHLWTIGERSKCNTCCSAWHQENYHSSITLCGFVSSKQVASQLALVVKNPPPSAREMRLGFSPQVGKIPWRRAWQPTPVFLPGESHRQRRWATVHGVTKSWTWLKWFSTTTPKLCFVTCKTDTCFTRLCWSCFATSQIPEIHIWITGLKSKHSWERIHCNWYQLGTLAWINLGNLLLPRKWEGRSLGYEHRIQPSKTRAYMPSDMGWFLAK